MQCIKFMIFFSVIQLISLSCKKSGDESISPASVNIVNAVASSPGIIPVFGTSEAIQYFANAPNIYYQNSQVYSPLSGSNNLYIIENNDTTVLAPKRQMFSGTINLAAGGIYSLFLAGDSIKPDTMFIQDQIPVYNDSSAGIRFINLSPGSNPISINLVGNNPVTQQEFSSLGYKAISSFRKYVANSNISGNYSFEVHDQGSGNLLKTVIWHYTLFRNNTLVISGSEDLTSPTPLLVFQINNY